MADRPLGIYVACGFFVLLGLGTVVSGVSAFGLWGEVSPGQPASVHLFVRVIPFFLVLMGALSVAAGVALWGAREFGRTAGLVWTVLWVLEEVVLGVWGAVGPAVVQRASSSSGETVVRVLAGSLLFYYLWTVGETYVAEEAEG